MTRPGKPAPSVPIATDSSRSTWVPWVLGLLALLLIGLVLFFLLNDDDDAEVGAVDSVTQEVEPEPETEVDPEAELVEPDADAPVVEESEAPTEPAAAGPLVLAAPFGDLSGEQGRQVSVDSVEVVDVPADEAFTIGTADDELLVYLTPAARAAGGPESATNVEPGSVVTSLEGTLEPVTEEFLSSLQLTEAEAQGLRDVGVYVAATAFELASP